MEDEVVVSSVADMDENFIWHERETSELTGETFTEELIRHLPTPIVKLFPEHLVILGGFVRFHG